MRLFRRQIAVVDRLCVTERGVAEAGSVFGSGSGGMRRLLYVVAAVAGLPHQ
jgi:hypothetical protein